MANYGQGIPLSTGFDLGAETPLDSRLVVENISVLNEMVNQHRAYVGMRVYCLCNKKEYRYNGSEWELVPDKAYVDEQIANVQIPEEQLANYATKDEIPTKTSQLENDSAYATESYVQIKIAEAELDKGDIDLETLQPKIDTNLQTTDKTVVGSINELNIGKAQNVFEASMNTVSSLGGIPAGTDLNGLSLQQVLTKLLFPYVAPDVSTSLTYSPAKSLYECGETVSVTRINTTITRKSEPIVSVNFYTNNSLVRTITTDVSNGGTFTHSFVTPISITSNTVSSYFKVTVNDGINSTTSNTVSFSFVYPYYYGVIGSEVPITETLIKSLNKQVVSKSNKSYTYSPNFQKMVVAYPKSYGVLKSILDPNGFEQMAAFTSQEISITGLDGTPQVYLVYSNSPSTNTNFTMTFKY